MATWKHRMATGALSLLPDAPARALRFYRVHGYWPSVRNPRTLNEKINWRILRDRRPALAWTCDKLAMKDVAATCELVRVPRTYWSGLDLSELAAVDLPARWVLKPNHRGGGVVFIGQGQVDGRSVERLERLTKDWLTSSELAVDREWAYSQARPLLLVEEFVGSGDVPMDYKFFVFHGEPSFVQVHTDRFTQHRRSMYSLGWELLPVTFGHPTEGVLPRPRHLARMVEAARELGRGFDFMRIDLYEADDEVWFGEFSPYPSSGYKPVVPRAYDRLWGHLWEPLGR